MKTEITSFKERSLVRKLARLWPPEARRQDAALEAEIRRIGKEPSEPCIVSGEIIHSGYGKKGTLQSRVFGRDIF